jgi:hypothetical protein
MGYALVLIHEAASLLGGIIRWIHVNSNSFVRQKADRDLVGIFPYPYLYPPFYRTMDILCLYRNEPA